MCEEMKKNVITLDNVFAFLEDYKVDIEISWHRNEVVLTSYDDPEKPIKTKHELLPMNLEQFLISKLLRHNRYRNPE